MSESWPQGVPRAIPVAWTFMSEYCPQGVPRAIHFDGMIIFASIAFTGLATDMNVHPTYNGPHKNVGITLACLNFLLPFLPSRAD